MRGNRKPQRCCWCGTMLGADEGVLFHVGREDENAGFGPMGAIGWLMKCPDTEACRTRRDVQKAQQKVEHEARADQEAEERKAAQERYEREIAEYEAMFPTEWRPRDPDKDYLADNINRIALSATVYYQYGITEDGHVMRTQHMGIDWDRTEISITPAPAALMRP